MPGEGTATSGLFTQSKPPSSYYKVYQNNVNNNSFTKDESTLVQRLMEEPESALFTNVQVPHISQEYFECKVVEVWKQSIGYISFALKKDSPYQIFMNKAVKKLQESRQLYKIRKKWASPKPDCFANQEVNPLGFEKIISLLIIICMGIPLSLILVFYEKLAFCKRKNQPQDLTNKGYNQLKVEDIKKLLAKKRRTDIRILTLLEELNENH